MVNMLFVTSWDGSRHSFVCNLGSKNGLGSSDQVLSVVGVDVVGLSDLLQVLDGTLSSKLESMFHKSSTQNNETSGTVSDLIEKVKPSLSDLYQHSF